MLDTDWRLRLAAFARLAELRRINGSDIVTSAQLAEGFEFEGERIRLGPTQQGIWKPRQTSMALAIRTVPPLPGRPAPYDDDLDESSGHFGYKYRGSDPEFFENRAVREAKQNGRPLIYLLGIDKGRYHALYPAYVTDDSPAELTFRVEVDVDVAVLDPTHADVSQRAPAREYATRAVKVRLHQRRFRELVVRAYRQRCAICQLRKEPLLDAAHILEDRHERGLPEIPNGLALCKIHHTAYDVNIMGVDADYRVHVREDVLREHDGPMLTWGLQKMDQVSLWLPSSDVQKPNREFLAERFERFQAA